VPMVNGKSPIVNRHMITTVIFDLDDTLFDEIDFCRRGFRAVAQHRAGLSNAYSCEEILAVLRKRFSGGDRGSTFNATLPELGIPANDDLIGTLVDIYRTRTPGLTLLPESRAVIEGLRDKYTLGLLTDGFVRTQRLKVQALGIEHYLKAIVYTKELGQNVWKPSLRGCEKLLDMLAAPPGAGHLCR
jgi:putative hydrolase of the HAD superfamily